MRVTALAGLLVVAGTSLTVSGPAWSASCATFESVGGVGLANACSGTSVSAGLTFRPSDPAPAFVFGGGFQGSGDFSTSVVTPGFVIASAVAFGGASSNASIEGSALGGSGSTLVSARLDTGTLRLYGSLTAADERVPASDSFGSAARFADIVTLTIPKSLVAPTVTLSLTIDGSISGSSAFGAGVVQASLHAGSVDGNVSYPGSNDFQVINGSGDYAGTVFRTFDPTTYAIDAGESWKLDVKLSAQLFAMGNPNHTFDFANTARLGIEMTEGITYTSDSDLLLTAAVPEPASVMMLLTGLALIAVRGRRKHR